MSKAMIEPFAPQTLPQYIEKWTYEDYAKLPDDGWQSEVIEGELYMVPAPVPLHQKVSRNLEFALYVYVKDNNLGEVFYAPTDVMLPGQKTPVQPDLLIIAADQLDIIGEKFIEGVPLLVAEILSPTSWWRDRRKKFPLYEEVGVPECWIVDPVGKTIEVYVLQGTKYALLGRWESGETAHSQALRGFEVTVDEVMES